MEENKIATKIEMVRNSAERIAKSEISKAGFVYCLQNVANGVKIKVKLENHRLVEFLLNVNNCWATRKQIMPTLTTLANTLAGIQPMHIHVSKAREK